jgi:hypothetical protein
MTDKEQIRLASDMPPPIQPAIASPYLTAKEAAASILFGTSFAL